MRLFARLPVLLLFALVFGSSAAQPAATKPGFGVTVEITFDEQGVPEGGEIVQSDDPTGDRALEQLAMAMARQDKQEPRLKDGKPVKFKARRPFNFPVEGDEGAAANENRPALRAGQQTVPVYPETLAAQGVIGGAIVELRIAADGTVKSTTVLRASHPEFAAAAETAVKTWTFVPNEKPGAPAESRWRVAVGFTLAGKNLDLKWRLAPRPAIGGFIVARAPEAPASSSAVPEQKK